MIFSSVIGTVPPNQEEKVYIELLEANLLWTGTGGATLGVDPKTASIFMCYQEKVEGMQFLRFQELLKGFSDMALSWNKSLKEGKSFHPDGKKSLFTTIPSVVDK